MDEQWQTCMKHFLESVYARSGSTASVEQYRWTLNKFFGLFPGKSPSDITRADVETFLSLSFLGRGPSIATRNPRLSILKSFYNHAQGYDVEREGGRGPLLSGRLPTHGLRRGTPARQPRAMSGEELRRLFAVIDSKTLIGQRDRALFLTYFYTARRRREILNLKWGDIIEGVVVDHHGQSKHGRLYRFRNKGQSQQMQTAELPEPAYREIVAYLRAAGRLETIGPQDYIFTAFVRSPGGAIRPGTKRLTGHRALHIMKTYARRAGLDEKRLCLHSFRHTSARERYQRGSGVIEIKELLCHASLETTYRYLESLSTAGDPGASLLEVAFHDL